VGSFTPLLNYPSNKEIGRDDEGRKELNKRRKRNIKCSAASPIRTHRTPAIGSQQLDLSTLVAVVTASAPTSRKAAASQSLKCLRLSPENVSKWYLGQLRDG
jgi:hypothetical protein